MEQSPDSEATSALDSASGRLGEFDRRKAIKYGGIAAGLVVATPSILTLGATPAAASGRVSTQFGDVSANKDTTAIELTRTSASGGYSTGLMVITVATAGNRTFDTPTSTTDNTWTLVPNSNMVGGTLLQMATYYSVMDTTKNATSVHFKVTWTGGARCAAFGSYFPTGSQVTSYTNGTPTSTVNITAPSGLVIPSSPTNEPAILFCIAHNRTGAGPLYTNPTGFAQVAGIQTTYQASPTPASGVAVNHAYAPDFGTDTRLTATQNYPAVVGTLGAARTAGATLLCVK